MRTIFGVVAAVGLAGAAVMGCSEEAEPVSATPGGSGNDGGSGTAGSGSGGTAGSAGTGAGAGGASDAGAGTSGTGGTGGSGANDAGDGGGRGGTGGASGNDGGVQVTSSKLDVLLVIDNSASMADKQEVLDRSAKTLVTRLTNPRCLNAQGNPVSAEPPSPDAPCPEGSTREMPPVRDMHIGVISSSLGSHGADTCDPSAAVGNPTMDDRAELLSRPAIPTYENRGYLVWDPNRTRSPAGESSATALASQVAALVTGVGEIGCGFEAPLEAWYRFLIDPEPPASVVVRNSVAVLEGTNQTLLTQRSQFLRPDSAVLILVLTDENDCSMQEGGSAWLAAQGAAPGGSGPWLMPKATSACTSTPNSPCCRSCGMVESVPPSGCQPLAADPACTPPSHSDATDRLNLRCHDQKRRFGVDFLHPIERYVRGLTAPTVPNRAGQPVQNPLFAAGRDPSLITIAGIVGVPWQDLARDAADPGTLEYMSAAELASNARWAALIGDPARGTPPLDPFMRESIDPRSGTNPITGDAIQPASAPIALANPINGHEYQPAQRDDLQYACIFRLLSPRDCASGSGWCDCASANHGNRVLCQGPDNSYGTTQHFAKAYPGLRPLELLSRLGRGSVVASICPRNLREVDQDDYAYGPAVAAIVDRLKHVIR